jgi:hypothetical protein
VFDDAPNWIMLPRAGSVECFFHYFGWLVGVLWREKSCGGNYRKRSRAQECAGVERQGKGRDMERKRATGANREKQGDGLDESLLAWMD